MKPLRIAVVAHARFHAHDLIRELLRLGHDVELFTNYPAAAAARFGIPRRRVRVLPLHGPATRVLWALSPRGLGGRLERWGHQLFGRWAARRVCRTGWDAVIAWSGVAEETFRALAGSSTLKVLQRGSSHIRVQRKLLDEEAARGQGWAEVPSDWIIEREEREYALADLIQVPSRFAEATFREAGVPDEKLSCLSLGVDLNTFRPDSGVLEERRRRILAGEPLRVLTVGTFSRRKGARDVAAALTRLEARRFRFRFVGPVAADARPYRAALARLAEFVPRRPQHDLPREYAWGDVFVLPTVEDGFAMVLTQALASGLPLVTTPHCGGPDLIADGWPGWLVPVGQPDGLLDRLNWLHNHRAELANAVARLGEQRFARDWSLTALQVERDLYNLLATRTPAPR